MKQLFCLILIISNLIFTLCTQRWPKHDVTTLKLLQIVHRHGERTPIVFTPNDPFKDSSYWPEGVGALTAKGKYRLYKTGKFIRREYKMFLGNKYNPREIYARSSLTDRCVESVQCLLTGAYPPKHKRRKWNWGNDSQIGNNWQPIPIQTFMPKVDDLVCNEMKPCPVAERAHAKIYKRPEILEYQKKNRKLFAKITKITGSPVEMELMANHSHVIHWDTLSIEADAGHIWKDVWSRDEQLDIIKQLYVGHELVFRLEWDSPVIKRLRAGGLVKELIKNINAVVMNVTDPDHPNKPKLFVYSTHDTQVAALMHALHVYNDASPPFGAALLFELHRKDNEFFLRLYYYNETEINTDNAPYPIRWTDCRGRFDCPVKDFKHSTRHLLYDDFDKECNKKGGHV